MTRLVLICDLCLIHNECIVTLEYDARCSWWVCPRCDTILTAEAIHKMVTEINYRLRRN